MVPQGPQMALRAEVAWKLRAGTARPHPHLPTKGEASQQRQEELETMCEQLQRQVGEMEVSGGPGDAAAHSPSSGLSAPRDWASTCFSGPLHTKHPPGGPAL